MDSPVSRRSLIGLAKKGLARCQKKFSVFAQKVQRHNEPIQLDEPVLEAIFAKLDLEDRMRMGTISRRTNAVVERMPLVIPFLMVKSDVRGNYELHSDNIDLIVGHILQETPGYRVSGGDRVVFNERFSHYVIHRILSRVAGVAQLWLDCKSNGHIAQVIVDFYRNLNDNGIRRRFQIEQLTVVGSGKPHEMDSIGSLLMLTRKNIQTLRFRHSTLTNEEESSRLWSAVSQCYSLRQLQYEPCSLDKWSKDHITEALEGKLLTSLILTGVSGLAQADVIRMSSGGCLVELAVVGDQIKAVSFAEPKARKVLRGLDSLLIQIDKDFSIEHATTRSSLLHVLSALPPASILEVIHVNRGSVADTARVLSYWLHLARDANRTVKLKLEDCSQERQDAAVGRLLRKSRESSKSAWSQRGMTLSNGLGQVILLDKHTWFGDDE